MKKRGEGTKKGKGSCTNGPVPTGGEERSDLAAQSNRFHDQGREVERTGEIFENRGKKRREGS